MAPHDPQFLETLYRKWRKLGWNVDAAPYDSHVDPELCVIETTHAGRQDDRLFMWLLTWVRDYHDLINTKRLLRLLGKADGPVLGAVFDIAMHHGADPNLRTITARCRPYDEPQILFSQQAEFESLRKQETEHGLGVYRTWGLYCSHLSFYDDAAQSRDVVLSANSILRIRALFGPNLRSEIVFHLEHQSGIAIKTLADSIGYAYSAVYNEVASMIKNGLIVEKRGRGHLLSLSGVAMRVLRALPL